MTSEIAELGKTYKYNLPRGICNDEKNNLIIADYQNNCLIKF